jgi:hypothetical protein
MTTPAVPSPLGLHLGLHDLDETLRNQVHNLAERRVSIFQALFEHH